jgi:glycosyltransferase involved in cell wall biosynthesis
LLTRTLSRWTLRSADLVTCDSADLKRAAVALGAPEAKTSVIHFGVDTERFRPDAARARLRDELGLGGGGPVIVSPRALRSHYSIETIIRSTAILRPAFPNVRLLVKDYLADPDYRASMDALVRALGLKSNVTIVGPIPYADMAKLYNVADVVVSLARTDSSPLSMLEAMACGVPIVATDIASMREWIVDGVNGHLASPDDPAEVARKLEAALRLDPETRERWARTNRAAVEHRADQKKNMSAMESLYRGLLGSGIRR